MIIRIFSEFLTDKVFNLESGSALAGVIEFFIYDSVKIFILLSAVIFFISVIRSFLPPEKIRSILSRKNKYAGNIMAALLGIITPFCSCSAIPHF